MVDERDHGMSVQGNVITDFDGKKLIAESPEHALDTANRLRFEHAYANEPDVIEFINARSAA